MRKRKPRPPGYYGGKQGYGKAEWIIGLMPPPVLGQWYVEPYGGMAGVMMAREPASAETYNDINDRLVNWWLAVRDEPAEFARLLRYTPVSRSLYERAIAEMDDMSLPPVRRAVAFHIIITQSVLGSDGRPEGCFCIRTTQSKKSIWDSARIEALADRMRYVVVENREASEMLEKTAPHENAVVYVDPPYATSDISAYRYGDIDIDELTEALLAQRGFCAISGYGDEWAHLGWHAESRPALRARIGNAGASEPRVEVLWINRPRESMAQRLF